MTGQPWVPARVVRIAAELRIPATLPAMWPAPLDGIIDATERVRARVDGHGGPPPDWQPGRVWKFPTPKLPVNSVKSRTYRIPNSAVWHLASCVDPVDRPRAAMSAASIPRARTATLAAGPSTMMAPGSAPWAAPMTRTPCTGPTPT